MRQKLQHTCKDHYIAASMMMLYNLKVIFVSFLYRYFLFLNKNQLKNAKMAIMKYVIYNFILRSSFFYHHNCRVLPTYIKIIIRQNDYGMGLQFFCLCDPHFMQILNHIIIFVGQQKRENVFMCSCQKVRVPTSCYG